MDQLTELRWHRYGQDRVYVRDSSGLEIGHIDLKTEQVVSAAEGFELTMAECAGRWLQTTSETWRLGARGEGKVGEVLATLASRWRVIHSGEIGSNGRDIDHVVIGPGGVFTLNTTCRPGGRVWVRDNSLNVNGRRTDHLRNSRFAAQRASRLLSSACGFDVPVKAGIVFVDLDSIDIRQMPDDVHITTKRRVVRWLEALPTSLTPAIADAVYDKARLSTTWI